MGFLFSTALILIFNVLFFILGGVDHTTAAWIAYGAIHLSYIISIASPYLVKNQTNRVGSALSVSYVSAINLVIQIVVGGLIIIIDPDSYTGTLVIELIMLIVYIAILVTLLLANKDTEAAIARQKEEVFFIRDLAGRVKLLMGRDTSGRLDKPLEKLYDVIFCSPTRSCACVKPLEAELTAKIGELEGAVLGGRTDDAERIIGEALLLIDRIQLTLKNVQ